MRTHAGLTFLPFAIGCQLDPTSGIGTGIATFATSPEPTSASGTDATSALVTTVTTESGDDSTGSSETTFASDGSSGTGTTSTESSSSSSSGGCAPGTEDCACIELGCDAGLACIEGICAPLDCPLDLFEPSETEIDATVLGEIDDADGSGSSVAGVLAGPADVDWYRYVGDDDVFAVVNPTRDVQADGALRICKFAECLNGLPNTDVACPVGTTPTLSPSGRPGCCDDAGFELSDIDCVGAIEDNMHVFIRVDQPAELCVTYTIDFHF